MRLARLLLISGLAARAVADAAADDDSPSRWSFRALTGIGRDDGAAAADAAAAAALVKDVLSPRLIIPGTLTGQRDAAVAAAGGNKAKNIYPAEFFTGSHPYIVRLLKMASEGDTLAYADLGNYYAQSDAARSVGMTVNMTLAMEYWRTGADQGDAVCQRAETRRNWY